MKKLLLIFSILIFCSGCVSETINNDKPVSVIVKSSLNNTNVSNQENNSDSNHENNNESSKSNTISIPEKIIYEENDLRVTAKGLDLKGLFGPEIQILIENNSQKNVTIQARKTSVNNVMVETIFSADVASGKKANDTITLSNSDLELAGIEVIKEIEFSFHIFNSDTWDDDIDTEMIKLITTADESYIQEYDTSGITAFDEIGVKIIVKKVNSSDSFWGTDVHLYIENNSDSDITVQARDVSVNGFMIDPVFSSEVGINKKAFNTMTFFESDFTENEITEITDLELKFHIYNSDTWDTIKDSEVIQIKF